MRALTPTQLRAIEAKLEVGRYPWRGRVLKKLLAIPTGRITTYGQVAAAAQTNPRSVG